jgi:DNA-binding response OmpR family regulator
VREPDEVKESTIEIGDIRLEPASHTVTIRGVPVRLTPKEFDILRYLMNRANQVVTYDKLLTQLWGADHSAQIENLRTFIRQLRVKIEDDPSNPFYLLTDAHIGYRFADVLKLGSHRQIRT